MAYKYKLWDISPNEFDIKANRCYIINCYLTNNMLYLEGDAI